MPGTDYRQVLLEIRSGGAFITINRPDQRNALSNEVLAELDRAVMEVSRDDRAHAIVITGAGGKAFSAGGDLKEMGKPVDAMREHEGRGRLARLFQSLWDAPKPTIARVEGQCLAGGFGLALACDIVIATETSTFGAPEVRVGLWPYMISVPLIRSMPPKLALRLMMTGDTVDAVRGHEIGFVTDLVPEGEIDSCVERYLSTFSEVSPQAVALGRRTYYSIVDADPAGRLKLLHAQLGVALTMPDATEGLAAFAERRKPVWSPPAGSPVGNEGMAPVAAVHVDEPEDLGEAQRV